MLKEFVGAGLFRLCHKSQLVYNTCWEDPRLDRVALQIGPGDEIVMITSGGCNALDYLLDEPRRIFAVDMNPRQNALLELKLAGIRTLDWEPFFALFGRGYSADWESVYAGGLRAELSPEARAYWDRKGGLFHSRRRRSSFYYHGSSGLFAWLVNLYIDRVARLRDAVDALLAADSLERQREIYAARIRPVFWGGMLRWGLRRDTALAMLGVPRSQRRQIDENYPGGIASYIVDQVEDLLTNVSMRDNYFWRVYINGEYSRECCPEYLKEDNFYRLKAGLVERVEVHTNTLLGFLLEHSRDISRFVLLDHMDWLYEHRRDLLQREWQAIVDRAAPAARIIWRSAAPSVDFVDELPVVVEGKIAQVGELLRYERQLAQQLHRQDRVHTYGSFHITQLEKRPNVPGATAEQGDCDRYELADNTQDSPAAQLVADSRCDA